MLIRSYEHKKIADYLNTEHPRRVCLIFWHGLGDVVMFMPLYEKLKAMFASIKIDIAVQAGLDQRELLPSAIPIQSPDHPIDGYDYTFQVHFPMCEHLNGLWTKSELCCREELGIEPISTFPQLHHYQKALVALNFHATALPDPINPPESVAQKIWQEVIDADFIPIESFFKHRFFNPKNEKFSFIDRDIRSISPTIKKLIGLLRGCFASICVASGTLPLSLALMPEHTLYLEKTYPISAYTRQNIPTINLNKYQEGSVRSWLKNLTKGT